MPSLKIWVIVRSDCRFETTQGQQLLKRMLILGIDTSGRSGSLALTRATAKAFEVLEVVFLAGGTYSARFIPELSALLARHSFGKRDLEAFAVVSGPGSFTGLRVGLSAAKGLAEILRRPVAAVSMLEAIAAHSGPNGRAIAALDAGRHEIYVGEYEITGGRRALLSESLLSKTQFCALLQAQPAAELITPDTGIPSLVPAHLHVKQIEWPHAGEIARLGYDKIQAGQIVPPEALEANYIRRSDAEIFSRPNP
jgi:tRNA threonylcarbamoyladenosine biosynthesis protein TsaB